MVLAAAHGVIRLAVVVSHPIQYYAPWFRCLASEPDLELQVFHLWDFGITSRRDPGFAQPVQWDLPLLEGYASTLVPNASKDPGTHHFGGLHNPALVPQIRAWRPDVLLVFGYTYRSHLRLLLEPSLRHLPVLFRGDSHGLCPRAGWRLRLATLVRRLIFRRFAAGLAVGAANTAWLAHNGIPRSRLHHVPHAVDNQRFQAASLQASRDAAAWRARLGIDPEAPVLLFVGKFEPKKRPLDLLAAFTTLNHPSAVLVFAGSGLQEPLLKAQAASLEPGRVHFLGFQNQSAMPSVYALADLVVLPSFGFGETWGLCINEAMNLARPVLVSSHVGCGPDLVIEGQTGWTFPAGDVVALTDCLRHALADPQRLQQMGRAARAHIDHFSYGEATAGLRQALAAVLPGRVRSLG